MKLKLPVALLILAVFFVGLFNIETTPNINKLRERHAFFLKHNPINKRLKMSKKERLSRGIPPNKYMENEYLLEMNPALGHPTHEKLFALQERLSSKKSAANRAPGDAVGNPWVERGPNNVGGRTRALLYDPNDATHKRVFAGGVSGGLWVNNDITNANSSWTRVGIPENLAVSSITYDPNNTNIFYLGTGESYVFGDVNGNGLWKSTDGGTNWVKIFGGVTGTTTFKTNIRLTVNSPGTIAGVSQVVGAAFGSGWTSLTGNLVLASDNTALPTEACRALINGSAITGNIAVIERGNCTFVSKIKNAQNAGAVAVLVVNNVIGPPIIMGGTDATITIPSVMISKAEGQAIIQQLASGVNVTIDATGSSISGNYVTPGIQHINDIKVRDIGGGNSEVYVAVGESFYSDSSPTSLLGPEQYGLYKSVDNGASWVEVSLPLTTGGNKLVPNDLEIGSDNTIWLSTTNNVLPGDGGGTILSSTDGTTFTVKNTVTNGRRTQIAVSKLNPGVIYILAELSSASHFPIYLGKTTDAFNTISTIAKPSDADVDISATDFTRGQAFYDLLLEVDPTNDDILYVGGIDLFRSQDGGTSWGQISKWSNNNDLAALSIPLVHADMHALAFNPADSNSATFGNDGGVYYASSLSGALTSTSAISERNKDYNVTQFYKGAIGFEASTEKLLAGAQDNGSQLINSAISGINSSALVTGGDGAYVFIDKDGEYMVSSYVYNSYYYLDYNTGNFIYTIANNQSDGAFINPTALDSNNNVLYASGTNQINRYTLGSTSAISAVMTDALLTSSPTALKASTFVNTTLFVGTENGQLLKLTNANVTGSTTWTDITGSAFYGSISDINFGVTENEIIVTFHNYGVTNIWFTTDGGTTWTSKEGDLPDLPVKAVMMNPLNNDEVIVGTDLGVWRTENFKTASPTWVQSQNGMQNSKVTSFDYRTADNTVLASTYGRGLFTGTFSAGVLAVNDFEKEKKSILVYPTASNGQFTIRPKLNIGKANLSIFDMRGRRVYKATRTFNQGTSSKVNVSLKTGIYILKLEAENLNYSQKIIIK